MEELIGSIGGLLMFILVIVLFYCFLLDSNIIKSKKMSVDLKRFLLSVIVLFFLEFFVCGMIRSFFQGSSFIIKNSIIWKNTIIFNKLFQSDYNYGLKFLITNGNMPLYYYIIKFLGAIVFNAYEDVSFYIGLLCGFSSYVLLYNIVNLQFKTKDNKKILTLLLLIPGNIFLFLPTPFAIEITLLLLFIYCLLKKKNTYLLLVLTILCFLFHTLGISAIIIWILLKIFNKNKIVTLYSILIINFILMIIGFIFNYNNYYESIVICEICSLFLAGDKIIKCDINFIKLILIFLNSCLLFGILINI